MSSHSGQAMTGGRNPLSEPARRVGVAPMIYARTGDSASIAALNVALGRIAAVALSRST